VAVDALAQARQDLAPIAHAIAAHLDDDHRGEVVRDGLQVVLAGAPNVGKSSLLNALARREVAIVSEEPGTTRDVLEVKLELHGLSVVVSDTAGIRVAAGKVEEEGIRRAMERVRAADLVLWLMDASDPSSAPPPTHLALRGDRLLMVHNKADLVYGRALPAPTEDVIAISALKGFGLESLIERLGAVASARAGDLDTPALTQARHRQHLLRCRAALRSFLAGPDEDWELRAEDLRRAAQSLGRLVGAIAVEDVLDQVFGRFCIGK
jgi:tRNA modification GTPase